MINTSRVAYHLRRIVYSVSTAIISAICSSLIEITKAFVFAGTQVDILRVVCAAALTALSVAAVFYLVFPKFETYIQSLLARPGRLNPKPDQPEQHP